MFLGSCLLLSRRGAGNKNHSFGSSPDNCHFDKPGGSLHIDTPLFALRIMAPISQIRQIRKGWNLSRELTVHTS